MGEPSPPPGWYPDPSGAPGQRYWDGQQWMILDRPQRPADRPVGMTERRGRSNLRVASVGLVLFALAAAFFGLLLPMGSDACTSDEQALICTGPGQWGVLVIATLGSIAAAAIALFGTWVAPKRGWFLALGYLGVLASVSVGLKIAGGAYPP